MFDGASWSTYSQSNAGLQDDYIRWILIEGDGVPSLPARQQTRVGTLQGSVRQDGQEAANCRVMLCSNVVGTVAAFGGENPCRGPVQMETVSDAQGSFVFHSVPIGEYELAVETPEGEWFTIFDSGGLRLPKEYSITEGETAYAYLEVGG